MNNLRKQSEDHEFHIPRPRSAGAKLALRLETPSRQHDTSVLTSSEKKDLVRTFIKEFLEDNPDAVLDSKLMAGLSEKANKLIDRSFHFDDTNS